MLRVLFDITRLLKRDPAAQPTGIDRVTLAYGRWLVGRADLDIAPVANVGGRRLAVSMATLEALLSRACAATGRPAEDHATWGRLTDALQTSPSAPIRSRGDLVPLSARLAARTRTGLRAALSRLAPLPRGDVYLNVSHAGLEHRRLLAEAAQEGLRPIVMVHDLIPITHPHLCAEGAAQRHRRRIESVLTSGAEILVNSITTADSVTAYAMAHGHDTPEPIIARLGIETAFRRAVEPLEAARPYFVAVGTIEPRKNLAFLLSLWEALDTELGQRTPHLVLVGRRGWEKRAVLDALDRSPVARRLVLEAGDLPDPALAKLVAGARALLAPSLVEGFDLPTLEALSLRTPVIASDIDAHRELARGALLLDPSDRAGWLAALTNASAERAEAPRFSPPTWRAHFDIVGEVLGLARRWDAAGGE
jgi:glycosyltransferase involved in cell wall biosynthesis